MAKASIVHCRLCGEAINKSKSEDWVMPSKNWYYHTKCYEEWARKKKQTSNINYMVEDEEVWKEAAYDYLLQVVKMQDFNYQLFYLQWEKYIKQGYTPKGILFTLRYIYDIKHCDVSKAHGGIGLVSFLYNEACTYWCKREERNKGIVEEISKQMISFSQQNHVVLNKKKKSKKASILNLASIAEMEDG